MKLHYGIMLFLLCFGYLKITASEIKVPVSWERNSSKNKLYISRVGFYEDAEKYIWALQLNNMQKSIEAKTTAAFYINSDDKKNTGRFPGEVGVDFQFGIDLANNKIHFFWGWENTGKKVAKFPLFTYPDDYEVKIVEDVCYLAIKKEIFKKFTFAEKYPLKVCLFYRNAKGKVVKVAEGLTLTGKSDRNKYFQPPMKFIRFGNKQGRRKKKSEAHVIFRDKNFIVWDTLYEQLKPYEAIPEKQKKVSAVNLTAAKGEYESFQFCISSKTDIKKLYVTSSSLSSGENIIKSDKINIRYVGYVRTERGEDYSDILYPDYNYQKAFNHPVLVTVKVPATTKAGIYRGTIKLNINSRFAGEIPVQLKVFDFKLPEKQIFKTAFSIKRGYIKNIFRNRQDIERQYGYLLDLCKEYKISPRLIYPGPSYKFKDNKLNINWDNFDKAAKKYFDGYGFSVFQPVFAQLGSHDNFSRMKSILKIDMKCDSKLFRNVWSQYLKQLSAHLKSKKMLDKTLFVIWDEPYTVWDEILLAGKLVKNIAPNLKIGVFIGHYEPKIAPVIDTWVTTLPVFSDFLKRKINKKKGIWLYNNSWMQNFNAPASDIRSGYWLAFKYNLQGFLSSEINAWKYCKITSNEIKNSWPIHVWMYPDVSGKRPFPSLRLALVREGLEDYAYLTLFKKLLKQTKKNGNNSSIKRANKLLSEIMAKSPEVNKSSLKYSIDSVEELNSMKNQIAAAIIELLKIRNNK